MWNGIKRMSNMGMSQRIQMIKFDIIFTRIAYDNYTFFSKWKIDENAKKFKAIVVHYVCV